MPPEFKGPLGRLAKVRHDFAHGKLDRLGPSHSKELYASMRELAPDVDTMVPALKDEPQPEIHLANLLLTVEVGLLASFEEASERRLQQERAMHEWWSRRHRALSAGGA